MSYFLVFIISFIIVYLVYFVVIVNRKKGLESFENGKQLEFFVKTYDLDKNELNVKSFANKLALVNSFMMALTLTVLEFVDGLILKLILCILILVPLMIVMYKILGSSFKKKEGK